MPSTHNPVSWSVVFSFPYREALGNLIASNNSSDGDSSSDSDDDISEDKRKWEVVHSDCWNVWGGKLGRSRTGGVM